jgi:hypothetical protein
MTFKEIRHLAAALALGLVLSPAVFADPPADKGKGGQSSQGKGGNDSVDRDYDDGGKGAKDKDDKKGHDGENHGQRVSECNHRANERNIKGRDRKDYVEWCVERGDRYQYDDRRYQVDRSCYRKADDRGLTGDYRRVYIHDCLARQEKKSR